MKERRSPGRGAPPLLSQSVSRGPTRGRPRSWISEAPPRILGAEDAHGLIGLLALAILRLHDELHGHSPVGRNVREHIRRLVPREPARRALQRARRAERRRRSGAPRTMTRADSGSDLTAKGRGIGRNPGVERVHWRSGITETRRVANEVSVAQLRLGRTATSLHRPPGLSICVSGREPVQESSKLPSSLHM